MLFLWWSGAANAHEAVTTGSAVALKQCMQLEQHKTSISISVTCDVVALNSIALSKVPYR